MITLAQIAKTLRALPSRVAETLRSKPQFQVGQSVLGKYSLQTGISDSVNRVTVNESVRIERFHPYLNTYSVVILDTDIQERKNRTVQYDAGSLSEMPNYWRTAK